MGARHALELAYSIDCLQTAAQSAIALCRRSARHAVIVLLNASKTAMNWRHRRVKLTRLFYCAAGWAA